MIKLFELFGSNSNAIEWYRFSCLGAFLAEKSFEDAAAEKQLVRRSARRSYRYENDLHTFKKENMQTCFNSKIGLQA